MSDIDLITKLRREQAIDRERIVALEEALAELRACRDSAEGGTKTPQERYGAGYWTGVVDEHAGIKEPEAGYPDDSLWLRGMRHGRADYRRRVASLLTEDTCPSTTPPRW